MHERHARVSSGPSLKRLDQCPWRRACTPHEDPVARADGSNGSISPSGTTAVPTGTSQAYAITPSTGYHVLDVQVDGSSVCAVTSYTFNNVVAAHTISWYPASSQVRVSRLV